MVLLCSLFFLFLFQRVAEAINTRVQDKLLQLCKKYHPESFKNVIQAMMSLGDIKLLADRLSKNTPKAIVETCYDALVPYVRSHAFGEHQLFHNPQWSRCMQAITLLTMDALMLLMFAFCAN